MTKRPDPVRLDLDDLVGRTIVKTAYLNRPHDDNTPYALLDDKGCVWMSHPQDGPEQEDALFIELGLWTAEEAEAFRDAELEARRLRDVAARERIERETYERLKKKFED